MILRVESDKRGRMPFRDCQAALDRIALGDPRRRRSPDTGDFDRDMEVDLDRALDWDTGFDWDKHSDYSDRLWPVGPAADIDSEDRRNIRGQKLVDRDTQDDWNRDWLVALDSGTGYPDREHSPRIAPVGFDRGHKVVERNPVKMDIPMPSGNPDWHTRLVDIPPFVRKDLP